MNQYPSNSKEPHCFSGSNSNDRRPSSGASGNRQAQGVRGSLSARPRGSSGSGIRKGPRRPLAIGAGDRKNYDKYVNDHGNKYVGKHADKHTDVGERGSEHARAVPIDTSVQSLMGRVAVLESQMIKLQRIDSVGNLNTIDLDRLSSAQRRTLHQSLSLQTLVTSGDSLFSSNFFQTACNAFLNVGISLYSRTQITPTGTSESRMVVAKPQDLGFWNYWNYLAEDRFIDFEIKNHARILRNGYCSPIYGMTAKELDKDIQFYTYTTVMEVYRYLA